MLLLDMVIIECIEMNKDVLVFDESICYEHLRLIIRCCN